MNQLMLPMPLPPGLGPLRERAMAISDAELLDEMAYDCPCSAVCLADCMALECQIWELVPEAWRRR